MVCITLAIIQTPGMAVFFVLVKLGLLCYEGEPRYSEPRYIGTSTVRPSNWPKETLFYDLMFWSPASLRAVSLLCYAQVWRIS